MKNKLSVIVFILQFLVILRADFNGGAIHISGEVIKNSGHFRIGDLIKNIEGLSFNTINGFVYNFSFNALNDYQHQNYSIFIDDHEIFLNLFDLKSINSLPINANNIDSLVIYTNPRLYKGRFENNGIIQIYTNRRENKKFYFKNRITLGNETKDSGPYLYTKYQTPNVDKIGSDYSGTLGTELKGQNLMASFHLRQNIFTDWSINKRIHNLTGRDQWPMLIQYGGSLILDGTILGNQYSLLLSRVNADNLYLYSEEIGHEIPLNYINNSIGFSLNRKISENWFLNSNFNYGNQFANNLMTKSSLNNYWIQENLDYNLEIINKKNTQIKKIGAGFIYRNFSILQNNPVKNPFIPRFYFAFNFKSKTLGKISVQELFNIYQNHIYDNFSFLISKKVDTQNKLKILLSSANELPVSSNSKYLFTFYNSKLQPDRNSKKRKYTGDLIWQINEYQKLSIKLSLLARYFQDFDYRDQIFTYDQKNFNFTPQFRGYGAVNGFVKGFKTEFKWTQSPSLHAKIDFTLLDHQSKDRLFLNAWDKIPSRIINYNISYTPSETFSVWLNIHHSSETIWREYENISGIEFFQTFQEDFVYDYILDGINRIDLKLQKSLMKEKVLVYVFLSNLSNRRIYYHPVGAAFNMSMYAGLEYTF